MLFLKFLTNIIDFSFPIRLFKEVVKETPKQTVGIITIASLLEKAKEVQVGLEIIISQKAKLKHGVTSLKAARIHTRGFVKILSRHNG